MSHAGASRLPTLFLPHGGGPCFYMDWTMGPADSWHRLADYLRGIDASLPSQVKSLLVISAHWEAPVPTVTVSEAPPLIYDYSGFPAHTYQLTWPAPGSPALAQRVQSLLGAAGIETATSAGRGFDHGVWVPLKLTYPEAQVPTVQLSLRNGLAPSDHLAIGRALAPLRDEGVLIIGSGMSYHNMRGFFSAEGREHSVHFDAWLEQAIAQERAPRDASLLNWMRAPSARESHPREEHLLPLMVAAGAAGEDVGRRVYREEVLGVVVSAFQFG